MVHFLSSWVIEKRKNNFGTTLCGQLKKLRNNNFGIVIIVILFFIHTVKLDHVVTSIDQSPVLKGHLFSCSVIENFI